jgi:hypothetical protein
LVAKSQKDYEVLLSKAELDCSPQLHEVVDALHIRILLYLSGTFLNFQALRLQQRPEFSSGDKATQSWISTQSIRFFTFGYIRFGLAFVGGRISAVELLR